MVNDPGLAEDVRKAEGGNRTAGTRARGLMQDVKNLAQEVREKILETRNAGKPE
jgi:hypothetical protein